MTPADDVRKPTLAEQIEACEHAAEWPRSGLNMAWCVKLAAAAATLRRLDREERWSNRDLSKCRCDHNEYCDYCFPPEFRNDR